MLFTTAEHSFKVSLDIPDVFAAELVQKIARVASRGYDVSAASFTDNCCLVFLKPKNF